MLVMIACLSVCSSHSTAVVLVRKMKLLLLLLLLLTTTGWLSCLAAPQTETDEEGWPRRPVEEGLLVQLYNLESDCLLVMRER